MPKLKIFDGESFAPRWMELSADRIVTAGRAVDCDVVLRCPRVARHHFRFACLAGRWHAEDLGSTNGTFHNGELIRPHRVPLSPGDIVSTGEVAMVFDPVDDFPRNPQLEAAIERNAADVGPFSVWADWLIEQRHPLGERIARGTRGLPDKDDRSSGFIEGPAWGFTVSIGWRFGLIDSFEVRSGHDGGAFRALIARLLSLPAGRFLRSLRFELLSCVGVTGGDVHAAVKELIDAGLPATVTSLDLGYGEDSEDVIIDGALSGRVPALAGATVFLGRARCRLVLEKNGTAREVTQGLVLGEPGTPHFARNNGRWSLEGNHPAFKAVRLNGSRADRIGLIHGDRISHGETQYRFEVFPAGRAAPLSPAGRQGME